MRIKCTLDIFLFLLLITSHVVAMENKNKEIELVEIHPEQIIDPTENENTKLENLPQLQTQLINHEDASFCTICLEPFAFDNGQFKIEINDKEFVNDHKIHESDFHKECIRKWMKVKNNCPICRKTLKDPFSNRVQKEIKAMLCNPGFWVFLLAIFLTMNQFIFFSNGCNLNFVCWEPLKNNIWWSDNLKWCLNCVDPEFTLCKKLKADVCLARLDTTLIQCTEEAKSEYLRSRELQCEQTKIWDSVLAFLTFFSIFFASYWWRRSQFRYQ